MKGTAGGGGGGGGMGESPLPISGPTLTMNGCARVPFLLGENGVPLGVGVLGEESGSVTGGDSSSTLGVNERCNVGCFGAMVEFEPGNESAGSPFRDLSEVAGDVDRGFLRLVVEDASSTVTGRGIVLTGVDGFDRLDGETGDASLSRDERHGLLREAVERGGGPFVKRPFELVFRVVESRFLSFTSLCGSLPVGSTAVKGGLGGPSRRPETSRQSLTRGISFVLSISVGSGVRRFDLGDTKSSLLPTASLLCALEKVGYGRLLLLPRGELEDAGRCISGMGGEARCLADDDVRVELRSGAAVSFS